MTKRSTKSSTINWRHEPKGPGYAEHVYVTLTDGRRAELGLGYPGALLRLTLARLAARP